MKFEPVKHAPGVWSVARQKNERLEYFKHGHDRYLKWHEARRIAAAANKETGDVDGKR